METKIQYLAVSFGAVAGLVAMVLGVTVVAGSTPPPELPTQVTIETESSSRSFEVAASSTEVALASSRPAPSPPPDDEEEEPELSPAEQRRLPSAVRPLDVDCDDPVVVSPPANDLAAVVARSEPGTCFRLQAGEYRFHNVVPKDWMTFLGESRDSVVVRGNDQTENAFHGVADGVTIGRMTLTGFSGSGGEKRQEQGAIRGTSALWLSDRGQMATDWLIEDIVASNNFATGVFLGDRFTLRGSIFENNGVKGLGGSEIQGGLIEGNIIRGNGALQAGGALVNGGGAKFTEVNSPEDPLVIRANEIYENEGNGVWCDIACNGFEVSDNYIHDHRSRAIMFELSSNAVFRDNLIINSNTWSDFRRDYNAGAITVGESSDVLVEGNYIQNAEAGVIIRQTRRPDLPAEAFLSNYEGVTYESGRVTVRDNVVVDTKAMGVSIGRTGQGIITDPGSIRFEANTYDNPSRMSFWWATGNRYEFAQWQDSGRDLGGRSSVPPAPEWDMEALLNPEPEPEEPDTIEIEPGIVVPGD